MEQLSLDIGRKALESILSQEALSARYIHWADLSGCFYVDECDNPRLSPVEVMSRIHESKSRSGGIYINRDEPHIIGIGSHQVVVDVGDGIVAKMKYQLPKSIQQKADTYAAKRSGLSRDEVIWLSLSRVSDPRIEAYLRTESEYLQGCMYFKLDGGIGYDSVHETIEALKLRGIDTTPASLFAVKWTDDKLSVIDVPSAGKNSFGCFTPDLREYGRYSVCEYDPRIVKSLVNGAELEAAYEDNCKDLLGIEAKGYLVFFDSHKTDSLKEAIQKMFLLQVPTTQGQPGKLVAADLDHISICKRPDPITK